MFPPLYIYEQDGSQCYKLCGCYKKINSSAIYQSIKTFKFEILP
jgi:hypothetical protein